ncbi:MAG: PAS domain-containing protein [Planctomycetota bacterium]|nr:PAS domain-containing protein [Planctomycetota bacterium]
MDNKRLLELAQPAIDSSLLSFWVYDVPKDEIIFPKLREFLGYAADESVIRLDEWIALLHPEDENNVRKVIDSCVQGGRGEYMVDFRLRCQDGSYIWVQDVGVVTRRDAEGGALLLSGVQRWLAHANNPETTLPRKQKQMDLITEISGQAYWDWDCLADSLIFSEHFFHMFGYYRAELRETLNGLLSLIHPDDRERVSLALREYLAGRKGVFRLDARLRRKSGEYMWVAISGRIVEWENDRPARIGGLFSVHGIKPAEFALQEALEENKRHNKNLRETMEKVKESLTRQDNLLEVVNEIAERLLSTGVTEAEAAIEKSLEKLGVSVGADRVYVMRNVEKDGELCFELDYDWVEAGSSRPKWERGKIFRYTVFGDWRERLEGGQFINIDTWQLDGSACHFFDGLDVRSILVLPIHLDGAFWGIVYMSDSNRASYADEAEIKALQSGASLVVLAILRAQMTERLVGSMEEAKASTIAKSDFLATISHEIRTPLNAILGFTELELQKKLPADTSVNLEKVYLAGVSLLGLINDILDVSKIEAGKFVLQEEAYYFPDMLSEEISINMVRMASKSVSFSLEVEENLPERLYGDVKRVKQIVRNLLSNAFKFTIQGSVTLRATCEQRDDTAWITFAVSDTGIGIRPEDMGKLFQDYSQIDAHANRHTGGTGLGLSICKSLAGMMGGTIEVESEYGKGSRFTCVICQKIVDASPIGPEVVRRMKDSQIIMAKRDDTRVAPVIMPEGEVLVVDDVITNQEVAKGMLARYGLTVHCVSDGREAVMAVRDEAKRYDMIFMDHMMPEMDGMEAVRHIRREIGSEYAETVPIVMMTANVVAGRREMFLRNGADDVLAKPLSRDLLDAVMRTWMPKRKQVEKPLEENGEETTEKADLEIPGVDVRAWLAGSGGTIRFYMGVLETFCRHAEEKAEEIRVAAATGDTLRYAALVHGLKGAARGINADTFAALAEKMERAGENADMSAIHGETELFLADMHALVGDIRAALERHLEDEKDAEEADLRIGELKDALLGMNVRVINDMLARYAEMPLDSRTRDAIFAIDHDVLMCEYEEAIKKIELYQSDRENSRQR